MKKERYIDSDLVHVYEMVSDKKGAQKRKLFATFFWGDKVTITGQSAESWFIKLQRWEWNETKRHGQYTSHNCFFSKKVKFRETALLKVRFVDVGQGDGAVLESPDGQVVFIDGGEQQHMLNYVRAAYSHLLQKGPLKCSAIVVSHGDADHFAGLTKLVAGKRPNAKSKSTDLMTAERVFHNGLVKRPTSGQKVGPFGAEARVGKVKYAVELENDLRLVSPKKMNKPFADWQKALKTLRTASDKKPVIRRLEYGDDKEFDFLDHEGISVKVLGPLVEQVKGKPALPFIQDASHTINGHSIVLKITFGNVRILFGADLNEKSEGNLLQRCMRDNVSLGAEILKVPHHGSADFNPRMLEAVSPVVSVVSSGDESSAKEYIHPRAGLVGALGKYSRGTVEKPLVYVTEMVAFFQRLKETPTAHNLYQKKAFGIVHIRTDGERVLVVTHSGKDDQKESYAFHVNERSEVQFEEAIRPV